MYLTDKQVFLGVFYDNYPVRNRIVNFVVKY
ncbi:hypothetical protein BC624_101467 [Flavobacterium granuli]|uniref:Uncharacterized protein n=1 Tax=Flavobacterium granuli TaxID=280093 RepID=A0A1M5IZQ7_9FLAO|nr:hypothetical protein BC624_101467 [Flavobacterium granuli]SHG33761.1 hypothetical protein SAMN05443373_101467 [Flavobacterium granuli]